MTTSWLIQNVHSGSYDPDRCESIRAQLDANGMDCRRVVRFPEHELPGPGDLAGIDILAIYTGDGTVNSAMRKLDGWGGAILVLPGGTMNLLSKKLHGDRDVEDIIAHSQAAKRVRPATVEGAGEQALVGMIVGPATSWAAVREDMRHTDIGDIGSDVSEALHKTLGGNGVGIEGHDANYPALNLTPAGERLSVDGFVADNAAHLLRHGMAWLGKDFREGPHERIGLFDSVTVTADGEIGILFDGEAGEAGAGETFRPGTAPVDFLADIPGAS
ncbi:diacylglycerol kinase family protein [uncultured Parasphingopyxis sp.]|uniref:diacylglycerol kinase family protein n=1 Tax=uncultured Parasphingopyxis sp. TaxID=1547918 RepID=UPI0026199A33|nr:diacylglycerol kinase family protein [uncultured Parasphingopyxis sp.]